MRALYEQVRDDNKHTLRVYPTLFFRSVHGNFETSEAILGPAIESLLTLIADSPVITETELYEAESALFDSAKNELLNYMNSRSKDALTPAFGRLAGAVSSARFINVNAAFRFVETGFHLLVSKRERDAFIAMRNPTSHGVIEGFTEERHENFYQCLNLYYKLVLAFVGYDGDVIAYNEPLFVLASFACHRYGVAAVKRTDLDRNEVERTAYNYWQKRRRHGYDKHDWYCAECQLSKDKATDFWGLKSNQLFKLKTTH
jgi:hypothetical protein